MDNLLTAHCDSAFSQLAGDNQYAHLGLVLLGVLSTVRGACSLLICEEDSVKGETLTHAPAGDVDVGVAVSREEAAPTPQVTVEEKKKKKKTKRRKKGDELDALFAGL